MSCARFTVSGRVQGVFFRASARAEAEGLGVAGYAKNLADGSVEVFACGDARALEELQTWLQHGPPQARVTRVRRDPAENESLAGSGFRIL